MKKTLILLVLVFITVTFTYSQAPKSFKYQAIVRNSFGNPISNSSVSFQVNIVQDSAKGLILYSEAHNGIKTNAFGMVNIDVGTGTIQYGSFSSLDWSKHNYYLGLGIDLSGGSNYAPIGVYELMSVPYALYAATAGNSGSSSINLTGTGSTTISGTYPNYVINGNYQTLKLSEDTIYLSDGGYIKLPYTGGTGITITGTNIINSMPNATHTGDATGAGSLTVVGLQGYPVSNTTPTLNQVLSWNGSAWVPANNAGQAYYAGTGLTLSGSTFSQTNHTGDVNGVVNLTVVGLQGFAITTAAPATGQALCWNGSFWTPTTISGGSSGNVSGTGSSNQLAFWTNSSGISSDGNLYWDNTNKKLGVGTSSPNEQIEITKNFRLTNSTTTSGIIYKGATTFIHNYGTGNTFMGLGTGNLSLTGILNVGIGDQTLNLLNTGSRNTAIGDSSLAGNTSGSDNVGVGYLALNNNLNSSFNTSIGSNSLYNNWKGSTNTAVGYSSMYQNISGGSNTAIGAYALYTNQIGKNNTAIGYYADVNSGGLSNATAIGYGATATANNQVVIGNSAVNSVYIPGIRNNSTSNSANVYVDVNGQMMVGTGGSGSGITGSGTNGYITFWNGASSVSGDAGLFWDITNKRVGIGTSTPNQQLEITQNLRLQNSSGSMVGGPPVGVIYKGAASFIHNYGTNNTFMGAGAGNLNITNTSNSLVGIGTSALQSVTSGNSSVAIGYDAAPALTSGSGIVAIGTSALLTGTQAFNSVAIGLGALSNTANNVVGDNIAIGFASLASTTSGGNNTAVGHNTLRSNTTGANNIVLGTNTAFNNSTGSFNISIGAPSMSANTTGSNNIGIGTGTLNYNTTASNNTGIGLYSMYSNTTGANNLGIGTSALYNNTFGNNCTALGNSALFSQTGVNAGNDFNNTAVGNQALYSTQATLGTNGKQNVGVGHQSMWANTTGYGNTALGYQSLNSNTTGFYNTCIGYNANVSSVNLSNTTAIGYLAIATSNDQIILGNSNINSVYCMGATATTSNAANMYVDPSTGQIMRSTSSMRYKENITDLAINTNGIYDLRPVSYISKKDHGQYFGLIAEEVAKIFPELVEYTKARYVIPGSTSDKLIPDAVRYPMLSVLMLNELKKHENELINHENRLSDLDKMKQEINNLKTENQQLKERLQNTESQVDLILQQLKKSNKK